MLESITLGPTDRNHLVFSRCSQCTACETGKYLGLEGKTAADQCTLCGKGKYNSAEGSQSESACSNCATGRYLGSTGAHSSVQCISCDQGRYSIATPGTAADQCTACIKGKYNSNEGSSAVGVGSDSALHCTGENDALTAPLYEHASGFVVRVLLSWKVWRNRSDAGCCRLQGLRWRKM